LLELSFKESGTKLDAREREVIDEIIQVYRLSRDAVDKLLEEKKNKTVQQYWDLVAKIRAQGEALAKDGYAERATRLLADVPRDPRDWPPPQEGSTMYAWIVVAVVAAVALILGFLFVRSQGATGEARRAVARQATVLAPLSVTVGNLGDRATADAIEAVRTELRKIAGGARDG
jgi:hypothetical protein